MSNVFNLSGTTGKFSEATAWVTKLDRGLTSSEKDALGAWLQERPENLERFLQVAETWDKMSVLARLSDVMPEPDNRQVRRPRLAAAAMLILAVTAGVLGSRWLYMESIEPTTQTVAERFTTYETAIGEQSTVVLPDGSELVLNTNSLLQVQYTTYHRIVTLVRGEVHVDVATDTTRPLSVVAGESLVQAVGTAFGVEMTDGNSVQVLVTEGEVLVSRRDTQTNASGQMTIPVLPTSSLSVSQGEEINLGAPGAHVTPISPEDIEVRLSWRDGNLVFRGETLEEALDEVERYTTVKFVFIHDSLRQEVIAGRFKAGDVEGLLAVLRENVGVAYERTDDGRVLLSSL